MNLLYLWRTGRRYRQPVARSLVVLGGALACSDAGEDVPLAQLGEPVIHGTDDRLDVQAVADDGLRSLALESAVVLLPERALTRREDGRFDVLTSARDYLCPGERFREQGMAALCSGVLVDNDLVLTAGHCANGALAADALVWAFGYALTRSDALPELVDDDLYRYRSVVLTVNEQHEDGSDWDFAFVELDRPVSLPRQPARIASRAARAGDRVTVIGAPGGVPLKVETGAEVTRPRPEVLDHFSLASDTFDGSSGSGVFDVSQGVVGVFVRGDVDYEWIADPGCMASRRVANDGSIEQASHVMPAIAALCASGWPSQRLCPMGPATCALSTMAPGARAARSTGELRCRWPFPSLSLVAGVALFARRRAALRANRAVDLTATRAGEISGARADDLG